MLKLLSTMMDNQDKTITALEEFGFEPKEIATYLELSRKPWVTVVELSQRVNIPRPTLYRILNELLKKGVIETHIDHKTTYYAVANLEAFQTHILESEQKTKSLQTAFDTLKKSVLTQPIDHNLETQISFFRGINGIKALEWEMVRVENSELCVFGNDTWWKYLSDEFAEEIRQQRLLHKLKVREILNLELKKSLQEEWTAVEEYKNELYQDRYISKKILPIENEIMISENAIYIYSLNNTEIIGIKILSPTYVQTMKALFELAWKISEA